MTNCVEVGKCSVCKEYGKLYISLLTRKELCEKCHDMEINMKFSYSNHCVEKIINDEYNK